MGAHGRLDIGPDMGGTNSLDDRHELGTNEQTNGIELNRTKPEQTKNDNVVCVCLTVSTIIVDNPHLEDTVIAFLRFS